MDRNQQILVIIMAYLYIRRNRSRHQKRKRENTSAKSGNEFALELLAGNDKRCMELLRMSRDAYFRLSAHFRVREWLKDTEDTSVEEKIAIFLFIIGDNQRYAMAKDKFQHSVETINKLFNKVLDAMMKFAKEVIVPTSFNLDPDFPATNKNLRQVFKGAVGVLDGILIHAILPADEQYMFKQRGMSECSQNVLAICDFNMIFTFIVAGWEGNSLDSLVLTKTIKNQDIKFPFLPPDKYYLCDKAYGHTRGYMTPYHNVRYSLGGFSRSKAENKKEEFNHAHAKLKNVIDRAFGVLKERFPILKKMISFPFVIQRDVTIACFAIHNFIRRENLKDELFGVYDEEEMIFDDGDEQDVVKETMAEVVGPYGSAKDRQFMENLREEIAEQLMQDRG